MCFWGTRDTVSRSHWPSALRRDTTAACWNRGFEYHRGHGCLCCVCCTVRTKRQKPGQARQRNEDGYSTKREQENKKNPSGAWVFVLCVISKVKGKIQNNQDKETSTDEVQTECKRKKFPLGAWMSVCCECPTDCGVSLCVISKPKDITQCSYMQQAIFRTQWVSLSW